MRAEISNGSFKTVVIDNVTSFGYRLSPYDPIVKEYTIRSYIDGDINPETVLSSLIFNVASIKIYGTRRNDNGEYEEYVAQEVTDVTKVYNMKYTLEDIDDITRKSITISFM